MNSRKFFSAFMIVLIVVFQGVFPSPAYAAGTIGFAPKSDFTVGIGPTGVEMGDLDGDGKPDLAVSNFQHGDGSTVSVLLNTSTSGSVAFAPKVDLTVGAAPHGIAIGDLDGDGKLDLVTADCGYACGGTTVSVLQNTSTVGSISFAAHAEFDAGDGPLNVEIRDLDGDGKPDLAVTNFANGLGTTVSVLLNTSIGGVISFASPVTFTTGTGPYGLAVGDLDGDNKPDLAVTNYGVNAVDTPPGNTVSILLNTSTSGNIAFSPKSDFVTGSGPRGVVLADFDQDGKLDLAITNFDTGGSGTTASILRNTSTTGNASFSAKVDFGTELGPLGIASKDLNGDTKLDLVVSNYGQGYPLEYNLGTTVSVLENTSTVGNIQFASKLNFDTNTGPHDVVIGDIDNDTKNDLVVVSYGSGDTNLGSVLLSSNNPTETTITSNPPNPDNDSTPVFSFTGSDSSGAGIASYECKIDAGGFSTCISGSTTFGPLSDGSHTFQVRAVDNLGNTDPTPASYTWTIDTTGPVVTIDTHPANPTNSTSATFTFSSTDGTATFTCDLDGGGYSSCSGSKNYSGLLAGSHTFSVKAADALGNVSTTSFGWTIDTTAPVVTIDTHPANPSNSASATFTFSSTDGTATFTCDLDGGGYSSCSGSKNYSSLADGSHTFSVKAADPAGNVSTTNYPWTIDTTAPTVTIDTHPANPSNSASATFTFSSTDGTATFTCDLDGGGYSSCSGSKNYSDLLAGSHTFSVKAADAAGNVSTGSFTWTIDAAMPTVVSVKRAGADNTGAASVDFAVTFSEAVTGVNISDFTLATVGLTGASISNVTGSDTTYTVSVNTGAGNGIIRLNVMDDDSIKDVANNPLGGSGAGNGNYSSGEAYKILKGADTAGVFRPMNGLLYLKNKNETGFAELELNYGIPGDYPVVGDWDGNGTVTIGIYRNGSFYLRNSNTVGFADAVFAFGQPGDQPIAGDWDGDGIDTIGVYRPSNGQFLLRNSNDAGPADASFYLGNVGDVGIAGDWNGDGIDTVGVFRPINGIIFLKNTNETGFAEIALNYGIPGDKPVTGDWNNDGIDTIGVYRNGQFMLRDSNTVGFADYVFGLGNPGDMPIAGNWDGLP